MASTQRTVLTETAYELIRQRLVDHDIEPGSKLNIATLSAELDVSPTPIREALARLEADGLVVKRNLAGYAAAPLLTNQQLEDLFEMRLLIEPAAAARAAVRIPGPDLAVLDDLLVEMRRATHSETDKQTLLVFLHHDAAFHEQIAASGGNTLMADTLRRFHSHAHLYRLYFGSGIAETTCREHERIVEALREADPDTAAGAMRTHIRRARERLSLAAG
ncbi:DNA-binding GntR family transcriptional regulator [Catenulispora sp. MAP12-49]|jgi:DNA-binding GntR family transcriptional regulator|uniref:GntR family transcriptional regulator n=1 Tax=unclassified Catenulispora TaxID=414885 RepID=UPI003515EB8E